MTSIACTELPIKSEIITFAATWIDLEMTILREVSQEEKDNYHMISLECIIKKKKKNKLRGTKNW